MRVQIHRFSMGIRLPGSEALEKVWRDGFIWKLRKLDISGSLLKLHRSDLDVQFQRTFLQVQNSECKTVKAIVTQGSNLGQGFFLVYMNGTCSNLLTHIKLFADDNSFFSAVNDTSENFESLSNDLCIVSELTS